jgi:hypothetical protein
MYMGDLLEFVLHFCAMTFLELCCAFWIPFVLDPGSALFELFNAGF